MCTITSSDTLEKLLAELTGYSTLNNGWDEYDAKPIKPEVIADIRIFLGIFMRKHEDVEIPAPILSPSNDGEMGLYWRDGISFAEVSFIGNGKISFYSASGSAELDRFDDLDIVDSDNLVIHRIADTVTQLFS